MTLELRPEVEKELGTQRAGGREKESRRPGEMKPEAKLPGQQAWAEPPPAGRAGLRRSARPRGLRPSPSPPPAPGEEEAPGRLLAAAAAGYPALASPGRGEQCAGTCFPSPARRSPRPIPHLAVVREGERTWTLPAGPGSLPAGPAFPRCLQFSEPGRSWASLGLSLFICKVGCC